MDVSLDQQQGEDYTPLALLLDELKSEDVIARLSSVRRLSTIALALGPERCREELIPFLEQQLDDEDEVLLALAEELGDFAQYVGGPEYAWTLLGTLENLAAVEETLVRDKAAESINKNTALLSAADLNTHFMPMLRRLSTGDWFTSRTSACALYATAYPNASADAQKEMRKLFADLCNDDTPMVRRAAAKALGPFIKTFASQHQLLLSEILPLYKKLASDDQDSVRLLTIPDLIALAELLSPAELKAELATQINASYTDKSWRVRYMLADHFVELASAVGSDIVREELVKAFTELLGDNEAEVRTAAAGQVPGFAKLIDRDLILARLLPCVRTMTTDSSQHVRSALAKQISGLAPLLGKQATKEHLLPLFLHLLKDEFSEVRLHLIGKLDMVNEVIGIEELSAALLPAIMELAEDKQWRVRQAIIEYIPLLATQLGMAFFDEKLGQLCMQWLNDTVFSIREAATINLKKLTDVFGADWAKTTIIPQIQEMASNSNYLNRMTVVFAITTIIPSLDVESIRDPIMGVTLRLAADDIPNIRFNVAKALETMAVTLAPSSEGRQLIEADIVPALNKMQEDSDADVRYFATRAMEQTQAALADPDAVMKSS